MALLVSCGKPVPTLTIDPIANGGVLRGMGMVTCTAQDPAGIRSVVFYIDAKRAAEAHLGDAGQARWQAAIDTSQWAMGKHYLTVVVTAKNGEFSQGTATLVIAR